MQKVLIVLVLTAVVLGRPAPAPADDWQAKEFVLAVGATASNLLYTPAKVVMATAGLAVGAVTGMLTGGDVRSAYAIWVPAASGTYFLTAANFEGSEPIEFIGSDYADRPSPGSSAAEAGGIYEAQYSM